MFRIIKTVLGERSNSAIRTAVAPEQVFNMRRSVIAVFQSNKFGRRPAIFGEVEEVGISRYNDKPVTPRILPNRMVRREPRKTRVENVDRIGEKLCEAANQFR